LNPEFFVPLYVYPSQISFSESVVHVNKLCSNIYNVTGVAGAAYVRPYPSYVVVYCHGNNETLITCAWYIKKLSEILNADVYAAEFPGYFCTESGSTVEPTEAKCFDAVETFFGEVVANNCKTRNLPVLAVGYSLGSALALHAAHIHRTSDVPHAVLLMAPFVSACSVVLAPRAWQLPFSMLWSPFDAFVMHDAALKQGHPICVAHGSLDTIVPVSHGRQIAAWGQKTHPKKTAFVEIENADHNTIRVHPETFDAFLAFLSTL
jgi:alpha-beta hydrolase superfamily lysophospholipase